LLRLFIWNRWATLIQSLERLTRLKHLSMKYIRFQSTMNELVGKLPSNLLTLRTTNTMTASLLFIIWRNWKWWKPIKFCFAKQKIFSTFPIWICYLKCRMNVTIFWDWGVVLGQPVEVTQSLLDEDSDHLMEKKCAF